MNLIQKLAALPLNAILPAACIGCQKEGKYICRECSLFVSEASFICPACFHENLQGEPHASCKKEFGLNGFVCMWEFQGVMKNLIETVKERGAYHALQEVVVRAFETMAQDQQRFSSFLSFLFSESTVLSYVPMEKDMERRRGFNQSELVAKSMAMIAGKKIVSLLKREPETSLDLESGKRIFSSFASEEFKNIVLVDDVWISGNTMKQCCKALKQSGVQNVWGFELARIV